MTFHSSNIKQDPCRITGFGPVFKRLTGPQPVATNERPFWMVLTSFGLVQTDSGLKKPCYSIVVPFQKQMTRLK